MRDESNRMCEREVVAVLVDGSKEVRDLICLCADSLVHPAELEGFSRWDDSWSQLIHAGAQKSVVSPFCAPSL